MELKGKAWKYGDNVDTDVILPGRYLNLMDAADLAQHCMEDLDKTYASKVSPGDFIVAGKNFGCGSSRETAPLAIKASGASAVIARTFSRLFYRNAFNMGLPIFEVPAEVIANIEAGDSLVLDMQAGQLRNESKSKDFSIVPPPPFMQELIKAGGVIEFMMVRRAGRT
jgi:3-isopropylmalate dehydratase small subunit